MPRCPSSIIPPASILSVLTIDQLDTAVPLAEALLAGGIQHLELTLRTPVALKAIQQISTQVPDMKIGAGTILTPDQAIAAKQAGASFGVAPGTNPNTIAAAHQCDLPFSPGICTPTDIELAVQAGCRLLKFFPAEPIGGLTYLQAIAAPFSHLGVKFIALGSITPTNATTYLKHPNIHAIGGSWIAPNHLIAKQDWPSITQLAKQATQLHP